MKTNKGSVAQLESLFPGWTESDEREKVLVGLPASGAAWFGLGANQDNATSPQKLLGGACGADEAPLRRILPEERSARYAVLRLMAKDPTIDSAIKMHIANAISSKNDTVESVSIVCREQDKEDKIVTELKSALMPMIERDLNEWARKAAVYGSCYGRIYGEKGKGIENVRCDYFTHPRAIMKYEKGGRLAGYTSAFQNTTAASGRLQLLPPWTFAAFEIPEWWDSENVEPVSVGMKPVDLAIENAGIEGLVESQEYGTPLIATAYGPWLDLLDAICSLNMSRRNAARLERIIGVTTGRLDPGRAASYLDQIMERISRASSEIQNQSFLRGKVQTVVNHVVPVFAEKGGISIDAVQGTPDINGLEDVLFHVKRLGSAIGVDPALLGFGDLLSGGLGDGGFFRVSVMAAVKADLLRKAIKTGIERLCEIHIAWKYGKVFLQDDKPWRIEFNALSTAIEREERETMEARANLAGSIVGVIGAMDQEFAMVDKRALARSIWKIIKLDMDEFEKVFPEKKAHASDQTADNGQQEDEKEDYL